MTIYKQSFSFAFIYAEISSKDIMFTSRWSTTWNLSSKILKYFKTRQSSTPFEHLNNSMLVDATSKLNF